jgi:hypothetical protein
MKPVNGHPQKPKKPVDAGFDVMGHNIFHILRAVAQHVVFPRENFPRKCPQTGVLCAYPSDRPSLA